ncbi:MAG: ketoacyl-ACP synthase III [Chitinophagaceae bacterium]
MFCSVITGTGSCIPSEIQTNADFFNHAFYTDNGHRLDIPSPEVVEKFRKLTGISSRRYASSGITASDLATAAAAAAIQTSGINPETIDQIIVAHNFGDIKKDSVQTDATPSLASRVKYKLGINNPNCIPYDILFGCPGWLQGVIQADAFLKAGLAKKCLVIGAETLSRVIDLYDRDSMIFGDGAGACIVELQDLTKTKGILSSSTENHVGEMLQFINMDKTSNPTENQSLRYIKMKGRKVYDYAMQHVPQVMKECLDKSGLSIDEVKKIFIHQANEKMDQHIVKAFYKLYDKTVTTEDIMPMSIQWLGNSSVATIPTLLDLVLKNQVPNHTLKNGDLIMFASIGAGMNVNAMCYRY